MSGYPMERITGVIAAMITPFDSQENVDIKRTEALVDFLLERDIDGLYLTGSTGEGFLMNADERKLVVDTVVQRVAGRKPVIVHIGDIGTRKSIELARHASAAGADAISSVPPFYWHFSDADIFAYYRDISEATSLPMVVYNVPLAGLMGTELLLKLAQLDNVRGLKFTGKDHDQMGHIKAELGADFMVYSGCDEMALSGLTVGADGIIGSFYNAMPEVFKQIYACARAGELTQAARLQRIATEIILEAIKYDYMPLLHTMITWQGVDMGYSRRPFYNYSDSELEGFKAQLRLIRDRYHVKPGEVLLLECV